MHGKSRSGAGRRRQGARLRALGILLALVAVGADAAAGEPPEAYLGRWMPYEAFDRLPAQTLEIAGGRLRIAFAPGEFGQARGEVLAWVEQSARMVADYYGRFPVDELRLLFVPVPGDRIHGTAWGHRGAAIRIPLGREVAVAEMLGSWVLPHEMVHLALPDLDDEQVWLEEGIATYVEAIARVQAGRRTEAELWDEFMHAMPKGQPRDGDRGLDRTHSWGRTYWGGAIFCLLADVTIRERSGNRAGLQQALRAVLAAGGDITRDRPVGEVLAIADRGTAQAVLAEMYARMKDHPVEVDLDGLWARLGVATRDGRIVLDDSAPLAAVRRAILSPLSGSVSHPGDRR